MTDVSDRVQIHDTVLLSDGYAKLRRTDFSWRRGDGRLQRLTREVFERGSAATILLYDAARRTVVLTRQFRLPAFLAGYREQMIEAAAGMLDSAEPEARIRAETEEETGYRIGAVTRLFEAFMSPGAVTERMHFFAAPYSANDKAGAGGGLADEGEDIEVVELPFDDAYAMITEGRIADAKTIILLQWAKLNLFAG
ncbi:MAG: NUDIX domain-containing protein [Proteobacteria bacterium]|nr:NUDIX domain-containing protein [Pseudomonadota bacterium]